MRLQLGERVAAVMSGRGACQFLRPHGGAGRFLRGLCSRQPGQYVDVVWITRASEIPASWHHETQSAHPEPVDRTSAVLAACSCTIFSSTAFTASTLSKSLPLPCVWPSFSTRRVERLHEMPGGRSTCASRLECTSCAGPRPTFHRWETQLQLHDTLGADNTSTPPSRPGPLPARIADYTFSARAGPQDAYHFAEVRGGNFLHLHIPTRRFDRSFSRGLGTPSRALRKEFSGFWFTGTATMHTRAQARLFDQPRSSGGNRGANRTHGPPDSRHGRVNYGGEKQESSNYTHTPYTPYSLSTSAPNCHVRT